MFGKNIAVLKHMKVMHPPISMKNKFAPSPINKKKKKWCPPRSMKNKIVPSPINEK